jgi:hypothetical protein
MHSSSNKDSRVEIDIGFTRSCQLEDLFLNQLSAMLLLQYYQGKKVRLPERISDIFCSYSVEIDPGVQFLI